jgi:ATP-dependent 26S proteasome regulatory subunit
LARCRAGLLVTGVGMGLLRIAIQMARTLAPAMVVLEDVDLIAQDRGNPFNPGGGLLFELLNELDGLGNDTDVIFALTSNRPEALEPALAARPGRIDLAVEFQLPGLDARVRLLELYARGLTLDGVDLVHVADGIDGASPAYIKELLRRAAVLAAADGTLDAVTSDHLDRGRDELAAGGMLGQSLLGFRRDHEEDGFTPFPGYPGGFPPGR